MPLSRMLFVQEEAPRFPALPLIAVRAQSDPVVHVIVTAADLRNHVIELQINGSQAV